MRQREESEKFLLSYSFKLHLKFSGNKTEARVISKTLKLPYDDRTDFTQLNRDCHWLILGHVALTKIQCIPIVIH